MRKLTHLLCLAFLAVAGPGQAAPSKAQVSQFIHEHKGVVADRVKLERALVSSFDLLLVDDEVGNNQYLTTLSSRGGQLLVTRPPALFGVKHLAAGNRRFATWYPHAADASIETITARQPLAAFRGLANDQGNIIGGSRRIQLPDGAYVNPVLSDSAFQALSRAALGSKQRLSFLESLNGGGQRLVNGDFTKKAVLSLRKPEQRECQAQTLDGVAGKRCVLRRMELQAQKGARLGGLRMTLKGILKGSERLRYRIGQRWHGLDQATKLARLKQNAVLEVFVPNDLELRASLAALELKVFAPARQAQGDAYRVPALAGLVLPGEKLDLLSQADLVYILDQARGDDYMLTQRGRLLGAQRAVLAPRLEGQRGKLAGQQSAARWVLSESLATQRGAKVEPGELFASVAADPLFNDAAWQWLAKAALGDSRLLRYRDADAAIKTQAKKVSQLLLKAPQGACAAGKARGQAGSICPLRALDGNIVGDTGDIQFSILEPAGASLYRVGEGRWRKVDKPAPLSEFVGAKQIELFAANKQTIEREKVAFSFLAEADGQQPRGCNGYTTNIAMGSDGTTTMTHTGTEKYEDSSVGFLDGPSIWSPAYVVFKTPVSGECFPAGTMVTFTLNFTELSKDEVNHFTAYTAPADNMAAVTEYPVTINSSNTGYFTLPYVTNSVGFRGYVNDDSTPEPDEDYLVTARIANSATGTARVYCSDKPECTEGYVPPVLDVTSISAPTVAEGGALIYTVSLSRAANAGEQVNIKLPLGTGTNMAVAADVNAASVGLVDATPATVNLSDKAYHAVTVTSGKSSFTVSVPTLTDSLAEASESLVLTAKGNSVEKSGTGTITDVAPPLLGIASVSSPTVAEGADLLYTVTLDRAALAGEKIALIRSSGTATTADAQYDQATLEGATSDSGDAIVNLGAWDNATLSAGATSFKVRVKTLTDSLSESAETLLLQTAPPGYAGLSVYGTGTITNVAPPLLGIASVSSPTVVEGADLLYTVTLDRAALAGEKISLRRSGGTATTADAQYDQATLEGATSNSGDAIVNLGAWDSATLSAGVTSFKVRVKTLTDSVVESAETLLLQTSPPSHEELSVYGTGTISDGALPLLGIASVSAPTVAEGADLLYTVTLDRAALAGERISLRRSGGTATTADAQYDQATLEGATSNSGDAIVNLGAWDSATLSAGVTSFKVRVKTLTDSVVESAETLLLQTAPPSHEELSVYGTGTITDVAPPALEVTAVSAPTAAEGASLVYTVSLSRAALAGEQVNVKLPLGNYAGFALLSDINATGVAIVDATPATLNLSDKAYHAVTVTTGKSSFTVSVPTLTDTLVEGSESLNLFAKGSTLEKVGTGTITDVPPAALEVTAVSAPTAAEGASLVYTVSLSRAALAGEQVNVKLPLGNYAGFALLSDVNATSVAIVDATPATLNLSDKAYHAVTVTTGKSSFTVSVPTLTDTLVEGSESLNLFAKGSTLEKTGTGTITDVVAPLAIASVSSPTVAEGGNLVFTVTLSRAFASGDLVNMNLDLLGETTATAATADVRANQMVLGSGATGTYDLSANKVVTASVTVGASSFTATLPTVDDTAVESSETTIFYAYTVTSGWSKSGTGTITDSDQTLLAPASVSAPVVVEGADLLYTVTLNRAALAGETISVVRSSGTATTADAQYDQATFEGATISGGGTSTNLATWKSAVLSAGATSFKVRIKTIDDTAAEVAETLVLQTAPPGRVDLSAYGTGTVNDRLAPASVSAPVVVEGADLLYTVTLNRAALAGEQIAVIRSSGTASTADAQYDQATLEGATSNSGDAIVNLAYWDKATLSAGVTSFKVRVKTLTDSVVESAETLILQTAPPSHVELSAYGTGTISDGTQAALEVTAVSAPTAAEGASLVYTVSLSRAALAGEQVNVKLPLGNYAGFALLSDINATSVAIVDATPATLNLSDKAYHAVTVTTGKSSFTVSVPTLTDALVEGSESLNLFAKGSTLEKVGTGTITDVVAPLAIASVSSPTVAEGGNLVFTVTLSRAYASGDLVQLNLDLLGETTATASTADVRANQMVLGSGATGTYDLSAGQMVAASVTVGATSFTATLPTVNDTAEESVETTRFYVYAPASVWSQYGTGTITDNDTVVTALDVTAISSPTVTEGGSLVYTLSLNRPFASGDTVYMSIHDQFGIGGTASPLDINENAVILGNGATGTYDLGLLAFVTSVTVGATSFTATMQTTEDTLAEPDEIARVYANGYTPVNANFYGSGTIIDNDLELLTPVSVSSPTIAEGGSLQYKVSLNRAALAGETISLKRSSGTAALSDASYDKATVRDATIAGGASTLNLSTWGSVLPTAGQTEFTVLVGTVSDSVAAEPDETLELQAAPPNRTDLSAYGTGTITETLDALEITTVIAEDALEGENMAYSVFFNRDTTATDVVQVKFIANAGTASPADVRADSVIGAGGMGGGASGGYDLSDGLAHTLIVDPGSRSVILELPSVDDAEKEPTETQAMDFSTQYTGVWSRGIGNLLDNDTTDLTVLVSAATTDEGGNLVYDVVFNRPYESADGLILMTLDGSAENGTATDADLQANQVTLSNGASGTVNLSGGAYAFVAPVVGVMGFTVTMPTVDDTLDEPDETAELYVRPTTTPSWGPYGVGTIVDNDEPRPSVTFAVTPLNSLHFTYGKKLGFGLQPAAFRVDVSGIGDLDGLRLETQQGSEHQVTGPGGSRMDVQLRAGKQLLTPDAWLTLIGSGSSTYAGLNSLNNASNDPQAASSSFIANLANFFDGSAAVTQEQMPDGVYSGSVSANFKLLWEQP